MGSFIINQTTYVSSTWNLKLSKKLVRYLDFHSIEHCFWILELALFLPVF